MGFEVYEDIAAANARIHKLEQRIKTLEERMEKAITILDTETVEV